MLDLVAEYPVHGRDFERFAHTVNFLQVHEVECANEPVLGHLRHRVKPAEAAWPVLEGTGAFGAKLALYFLRD